MAIHETATLDEFAELTGIIMRALPKAIVGLDIRETLKLAATSDQLSGFLREVLTSLNKPVKDQKVEVPIVPALPTKFTIADRVYELVPFLKEGESLVTGDTMVERAKELDANLGEEDCEFILKHQNEIPQEFRGKFDLVFTGWRGRWDPRNAAYLFWDGNRWYLDWRRLDSEWGKLGQLVHRRPSTSPA